VRVIESFRFKVHPLFIPIINSNLLDKTIRTHLVQFIVHTLDRGHAMVYRIYPSQWEDIFYRYHWCDLRYALFDNDKCAKDSCIGCRSLDSCTIFRAQYERKKATIQDARYEETAKETEEKYQGELGEEEIERRVVPYLQYFIKSKTKGRIYLDPDALRIIARKKVGLNINLRTAWRVKKAIEIGIRDGEYQVPTEESNLM
jgi:hypothetical protein